MSKPIILGSSLVRENVAARRSSSVAAVQDELFALGHWEVIADPEGYWGRWTHEAAVEETGLEDPVEAARALGFVVLP